MWCLTSRESLEVLAADSVGRLSGREEATSIRIDRIRFHRTAVVVKIAGELLYIPLDESYHYNFRFLKYWSTILAHVCLYMSFLGLQRVLRFSSFYLKFS